MQINISLEVKEFIFSLQPDTQVKVTRNIDLLEEFGHQLRMPHSKNVSVGLFELRIHGRQEIRIFYCFNQNQIYLLSGFIKKSQNIPIKELTRAESKRKQLISP